MSRPGPDTVSLRRRELAARGASPPGEPLPGDPPRPGDPPQPGEQERPGTAVIDATKTRPQRRYTVLLFDDDEHYVHEVVHQVQKATGCSLEVAEFAVREVMRRGRAPVFEGERLECERVASVLRTIRLTVEITQV